ncbi:MAG: DUF177 domain-containing protein [Rhodobacteraceae bacterium]|nr:DUF177 domain-containing protein [Paracoccaceae bacterium]
MPPAPILAPALRPAELARGRPTPFAAVPDAAARAALAADLGLEALPALRLEGEIRPAGRADWELEARLAARVVQPCVLTLAPVETTIDEPVSRLFLADPPPPPAGAAAMPEDDRIEPLGATIDLGAILREALALALPDYPRAAGAAAPPAPAGAGENGPRQPFAALAGWRPRPPGG